MPVPTLSPVEDLPSFGEKAGTVNVIVETPAGSRCKFKYESKVGLFTISKILPEGFVFPFDFGFIPGTRAEDGDPIDVMFVAEAGTATGCLVPARLFGVLEAEQRGKKGAAVRNDRLLAVPLASREYAKLSRPQDMAAALREQIEYFLTSYGALDGKTVRITQFRGPKRAVRLVRQAGGKLKNHG